MRRAVWTVSLCEWQCEEAFWQNCIEASEERRRAERG
jgi:hypothetical protein